MDGVTTRPERTAIHRTHLSVPCRLALTDGLLTGRTVLDFGCGRGGDVRRLSETGIEVRGWDPHYRPEPQPQPADVVFCNYVLNVVPDPEQRAATLQRAFGLAKRILVVAVRGTHEQRHLAGQVHRDGTLTSRDTFHHLFGPAELRSWLKVNLDGAPVLSVHPGIAYIFKEPSDRAQYLSQRYGSDDAPDTDGEILHRLITFVHMYGRAPTKFDQPELCRQAADAYGTLARALGLAHSEASGLQIEHARRRRHRDLLVVLALERFHGALRPSNLPADRVVDAKVFYDDFRAAVRDATRLLWATGKIEHIQATARHSSVGKTSPTALYVHVDAERYLPPLLRIYAACAALVAGMPPTTTLLKLHHDRSAVSFLEYPDFERDPHPRLAASINVDLRKQTASWTDWSKQRNRPLIHRKEEFLHADDPRFDMYRRLTASEIRAGLYRQPERIGREDGWNQILAENGRTLRGHRLLRIRPNSEGRT